MSRPDQNKAMHEYLDALLFEDEGDTSAPAATTAVADTEKLERLLASATVVKQNTAPLVEQASVEVRTTLELEQQQAEEAALEAEFARAAELERSAQLKAEQAAREAAELAEADALIDVSPPPVSNMQDYQAGDFQALFFSVAGLNLAVPLKSLGGIHQWKEPNTIFGKPQWYLGIMTNREEKLNVVDTALWVMPEKYTPQMAEQIDYKYLIMLGESDWGLACESLVTTETLSPDDIQWRKSSHGKRPWLAGVVREKMCAILDVDALTQMLDQGLNSQD